MSRFLANDGVYEIDTTGWKPNVLHIVTLNGDREENPRSAKIIRAANDDRNMFRSKNSEKSKVDVTAEVYQSPEGLERSLQGVDPTNVVALIDRKFGCPGCFSHIAPVDRADDIPFWTYAALWLVGVSPKCNDPRRPIKQLVDFFGRPPLFPLNEETDEYWWPFGEPARTHPRIKPLTENDSASQHLNTLRQPAD